MHRLLPLLLLLLASASWAQSAPGPNEPVMADKTQQLRKQIDETRKKLDTLEQQLAIEEQKKLEQENARQLAREEAQDRAVAANQPKPPAADPIFRPHDRDFALSFVRNVAEDEKAVWMSPLHLGLADTAWLLPLAAFTAGVNASDVSIEQRLPSNPTLIRRAHSFSNYATYSMIGATGGLFAWGHLTHNDHQVETGFLAGEAFVDSFLTTEAIKKISGR